MVIPDGVNIPMPRPFGGTIPVISRAKRSDNVDGNLYTVQFVGEIGPITQYLELLQVLDNATENDQVKLVIDSPGGDVYTAQHIVERMDECKAQVITVASGLVASAATFVWCAGKVKEVGRWGRFMFHSSLHGDWGKSLAIKENATELVNYMATILTNEMKAGILLGAEIAKILRDKADVEIAGSAMKKRLAKATAEGEVVEPTPAPVETPAETPAPAEPAKPEEAPAEQPAETPAEQPAEQPAEAPAAKCGKGKKNSKKRAVRDLFASLERLLAEDEETADSDVTATPEPETAKPDQGENVTLPPAAPNAPAKEAGQTDDASLTKKEVPVDVFDFAAYLRAEGVEPTPEETPAETPAPAPAEPAEQPAEQPAEPAEAPAEPAAPVEPTARKTGRYW